MRCGLPAPGFGIFPKPMHVFRHSPELTTVGRLWQQCTRVLDIASSNASFQLLQAFARLECALADTWSPERDDLLPDLEPFQEASVLSAQEYLDLRGKRMQNELYSHFHGLKALLPPEDRRVALSTWEGFRYYALFPERYAGAAGRWSREHRDRPAWVIGLRSMGSVLGPIVAAQLRQAGHRVRYTTLRPRGNPCQRQCWMGVRMEQAIREWPGDLLLVDEGPGLSGSSFGGAAKRLVELGVAFQRIALFPGWDAPANRFNHPPSAAIWERLPRYAASPMEPPEDAVTDLSAGRWRTIFPSGDGTAAWPQHERMKYLNRNGEVIKFAGLGAAAESSMERARRLAAAGFAPKVTGGATGTDMGWIRYQRLPATPLRWHPDRLREWSETAGDYLAFLASRFPFSGQKQAPPAELLEMVSANLQELRPALRLPHAPDGVPVALDARMLPEEWGWAQGRWIKFDGIDHCDDPFFPGPCDIAWDLASVEIEYGTQMGEAVLRAYCRRSGDVRAGARLPWYRLAYCAFRIAYCRLAAVQTAEPDASRWSAQAARYEASLRWLVEERRGAEAGIW